MDQMMIFTETNIYILSKLVALIRRDAGTRHRLTSHETILGLLYDAARSSNERIQGYYFRFLENLSPEQLVGFRATGLLIPDQYMRKPGLLPTPMNRQYAYMSR